MAKTQVVSNRVVVLGASNLTRGIVSFAHVARATLGAPVDLLAVLGHGRSYGSESRIFFRSLPPIVSCGVWRELDAREALPTWGLITDIGNDVLYGSSVEQISSWVDDCLSRLSARCERVVTTSLPMESVLTLSPERYMILRKILFPSSRLSFERAIEIVQQLDRRILEITLHHRAIMIQQPREWFGFDPIHVRRRQLRTAWQQMLAPWRDATNARDKSFSWRAPWLLRARRPEFRKLFGVPQWQSQPCAMMSDGTRVSFF